MTPYECDNSNNAGNVGTDDEHNENLYEQGGSQPMNDGSPSVTPSFSSILCPKHVTSEIHFRTLVNDGQLDSFDSFPVVQNYVNNVWSKFGLKKLMMNDDGVNLFKFSSKSGMELVLEKGLWMIRNSPIISLRKGEVNLLCWMCLITSSMCVESWGRISFAWALIEVSSDSDLKKEVTMAIPNEEGNGPMKDHEEGFIEVKGRKKKGKACSNQHRQISGIKLSKPKSNFQYFPIFKPGKYMDDASNLGANGPKDGSSSQPYIAKASLVDSNNSFEANEASKQTSYEWTKDFESDDEVDEVLYHERNKFGDQFDIRLKGRVRK
nr:hypothetical protein [Tanacetum cinerariifolium]